MTFDLTHWALARGIEALDTPGKFSNDNNDVRYNPYETVPSLFNIY